MSNELSRSARAIAVTEYVSHCSGFDQALEIYDKLGGTTGPIDEVLNSLGVVRFSLYEGMNDDGFWELIENMAYAIEAARDHFGELK